TTATTASNVGSYPITAVLGTLASGNYSFSFVNGSLSITKATLAVNADNQVKTYGDSDPAPTYTLLGFRNSQTEAGLRAATPVALSGSPVCTIDSHSENAGTYTDVISCTVGTLSATNYQFVV